LITGDQLDGRFMGVVSLSNEIGHRHFWSTSNDLNEVKQKEQLFTPSKE
jgi:hypothetical protein